MDKVIDNRFERLEKALATLINSISTYNPSPSLANDLVTADAELNQGLEQLSKHQSNYSKILALRSTSANLDTQIRDTITLLTTTRSTLIATPATVFPTNINQVSYSELLSYARRISKTTQPPNYREPEPKESAENTDGAATGNATPKDNKSDTQTNGTTTPIAATNGVEKDANAMEIDTTTPFPPSQLPISQITTNTATTTTNTSLPPPLAAFLDPSKEQHFFPWVTEDKLRRGALASIQILTDQGIDPAEFDPERVAELEAETKRRMEVEEEERERVEGERRREMERRLSVSAGGGERAAPKRFELETFDEDDDEED